jgi:hypothetical protein
MIQFVFKICYTAKSIRYEAPDDWTTEYFFYKIRDNISVDFGIPNTYHIVPGPRLQIPEYHGYSEQHEPVEMRTGQLLIEYCHPTEINVFYIRIIDEPESSDSIHRV